MITSFCTSVLKADRWAKRLAIVGVCAGLVALGFLAHIGYLKFVAEKDTRVALSRPGENSGVVTQDVDEAPDAPLLTACPALADTSTNLCFTIHWPLLATSANTTNSQPLLRGDVTVKLTEKSPQQNALKIVVRIIRPSDENHRTFWNKTLAYPQYGWMSALRVWDDKQQWLWPNLPYLLRATGLQRIERYGGWDVGKNVDNDFAAVLIRAYGADGAERAATIERPLVSAEWYPDDLPPDTETYPSTIVHIARSDAFTVPLPRQAQRGTFKIWLIYADFFDSSVPRGWPKEREFDGGILKFFTVTWTKKSPGDYAIEIQEDIPPESTRFDWKRWHDRPTATDNPDAPSRLMLEDGN